MNRAKFTLGIIIAVFGGAIMLFSMVSTIIQVAGNLYEDIRTFNIDLQDSPTSSATPRFSLAEEKSLSLWLRLPDRRIENKAFEIDVFLLGNNDLVATEFNEDFEFGYFRNSSGKGQYYRLGSHSFCGGFNGYFRYETTGKWVPPFDGQLVLRRSSGFSVPVKQIGLFVAGIFVLLVGIGTIAKNS